MYKYFMLTPKVVLVPLLQTSQMIAIDLAEQTKKVYDLGMKLEGT